MKIFVFVGFIYLVHVVTTNATTTAKAYAESSVIDRIKNWPSNTKTGPITQMQISYHGYHVAWLFTLELAEGAEIKEATGPGVGGNVLSFKFADKLSSKFVFLVEDATTMKRSLYGLTLYGESLDRISDLSHDVKGYTVEQHGNLNDASLDRHVLYTATLDGGATTRLFQTWYTDDTNIAEIPFPGTATSITQFASFTRWNRSNKNTRRLERYYFVADGKLYGVDNDDGTTIARAPLEASQGHTLWVPSGAITPGTTPSFTFTYEFNTGRSGWVVFKDTSNVLWASSISENTLFCISDCRIDGKYVRQISQNTAGGTISKFTRTHFQHRAMFVGDVETAGKPELFHVTWCYGDTCTIDAQAKISGGTHSVVDFAPLRYEVGAAVFLDDAGALWAGRIGGDAPVRLDTNTGAVTWFDTAQSAWILRASWGPDTRAIRGDHMRRVFWRASGTTRDRLYSAGYLAGNVEADSLTELTLPMQGQSAARYSRMAITANGEQLTYTTQPANGSSAKPVLYSVAANGGDVVQIFPEFDPTTDQYSFSSDRHQVAMLRGTGEIDTNISGAAVLSCGVYGLLGSIALLLMM